MTVLGNHGDCAAQGAVAPSTDSTSKGEGGDTPQAGNAELARLIEDSGRWLNDRARSRVFGETLVFKLREALLEYERKHAALDQIDALAAETADELRRALTKFGPFNSGHEGKAVIEEELDELWEHVKADTWRSSDARKEAIQIAAMALRYVHDLCDVAILAGVGSAPQQNMGQPS